MGTPYKMKGSPMQRNYGIASPAKQNRLIAVSDSLNAVKGNTLKVTKGKLSKKVKYKYTKNEKGNTVGEVANQKELQDYYTSKSDSINKSHNKVWADWLKKEGNKSENLKPDVWNKKMDACDAHQRKKSS